MGRWMISFRSCAGDDHQERYCTWLLIDEDTSDIPIAIELARDQVSGLNEKRQFLGHLRIDEPFRIFVDMVFEKGIFDEMRAFATIIEAKAWRTDTVLGAC